jgi:hypothetical protein
MTLYLNKDIFWKLECLKPSLRWKCRHFLSTLYVKSLIQDKQSKLIAGTNAGLAASPISSTISREIYGRASWQQMVPRLVNLGAIAVGRSYEVGKACKEFRLLPPNNEEIRHFRLPEGKFYQRVLKAQEILSNRFVKGVGANWVVASYKALAISEEADDLLAGLNLAGHSLLHAEATLQAVKERRINFSRCEAGRLHYPVSNLKRELRKLLLLNGEQVVEIDVSASQPTLHASLYHSDCAERKRYFDFVTSPRFYETVAGWGGFEGPRGECKDLVFGELFYGCIFPEEKPAMWHRFYSEFPILAARMEEIKRRGNGALPHRMQRLEAEIVIDTTCSALKEAGIPVLTVHDSIMVPVSRKQEAQEIFRQSWLSRVGFEPKFKS